MKISELNIFTETPCLEARTWLLEQPDLRTAWDTCKRGDWLWWALRKSGNTPDKKTSVAFAKWCVKRATKYSAYAIYAAESTANAASADYAAYAAADAAATSVANINWITEKLAQAEWIRKHVKYPPERKVR